MGGVIISLMMGLMIASSTFIYSFKTVTSEQKIAIDAAERSKSVDIAISGLHIGKDALMSDANWNNGVGMDRNKDDVVSNGTFALYSESLDSDVENLDISKGKLSVKILPVSAKTVYMLSKGSYGKSKVILATTFNVTSVANQMPVTYAGGGSFDIASSLCSYSFDEDTNTVGAMTNPNFAIYNDAKFQLFGDILQPDLPDDDESIKDVRMHLDGQNESGWGGDKNFIIGYGDGLDSVYSESDVYVGWGTDIGTVESGGDVTVSGSSNVGTVVENSDYEYPEVDTQMDDYTFDDDTDGLDYVCAASSSDCKKTRKSCFFGICKLKNNGNVPISRCFVTNGSPITLPEGKYGSLTIRDGCDLNMDGENYKIKKLNVYNGGNVQFGNPSMKLETKDTFIYKGEMKLETGDRGNFISLKSETLTLTKGAKLTCADPKTCLVDTNDLVMGNWIEALAAIFLNYDSGTTLQSTAVVRHKATVYGANVVGNLIAEKLDKIGGKFCNVVDKDGNQLVAQESFFDIIDSDNSLNPLMKEVQTIVCGSEQECINTLNNL